MLQPSATPWPRHPLLTPQVNHFGMCQLEPKESCLRFLDTKNATEVQHLARVWQVRARRPLLRCPLPRLNTQHGALQALHMARPCQAAGACLQRPRCICSSRLLLPRPSQPPQDYFVFGFSRNILARAISQYRYLTHFMAACRLVSWGDFCRDPFVLGDVCKRGEPAGRPCCTQSPVHQYVHVLPQAHCFTTARNESVSPGLLRSLPAVHGDDQCSS